MKAGFFPSSLALTAAWVYMATTGLLIAETSLNLAQSHRPGINTPCLCIHIIHPSIRSFIHTVGRSHRH